jgi:hypothetical protein
MLDFWSDASLMFDRTTDTTFALCLLFDSGQVPRYYTWSLPIDTTGSGYYLALACHLVLTSFLHVKFISFALPQHKV